MGKSLGMGEVPELNQSSIHSGSLRESHTGQEAQRQQRVQEDPSDPRWTPKQLQGRQDVPSHTRKAAAQDQPGLCIIPDYGELRAANGHQPITPDSWRLAPRERRLPDPAQGWPSAPRPLCQWGKSLAPELGRGATPLWHSPTWPTECQN